ncbi:MAG: DNA polymerase III subunit alpha, partial [Pseudomonadota bacterium]
MKDPGKLSLDPSPLAQDDEIHNFNILNICMKNFIHLRCHSSFSLAEGALKIEDIVDLAKKNKMPAIAVTDTGNLFCSLEFSLACAKNGIQPIIGILIPIDMQEESEEVNLSNIILLAKDKEGFQNLLKLSSKIFIDKHVTLPNHIKFSDLKEYNAGLIVLSGGHTGPMAQAILKSNNKLCETYVKKFKAILGDRFYIELMRHGIEIQEKIEDISIDLAYKHNVPLVATNDVMFSESHMYKAHHVLTCIAQGSYANDESSHKFTKHHYFKSAKEMEELFVDLPEAIANTAIIAKRCSVMAESKDPMLPKTGDNELDELITQAKEGLKQRLSNINVDEDIYYKRLDFELEVIKNMGFPGYFLIVSDFIKWSKKNNIPVGPGRGSGAGSIVAWSLYITDLDPIRFGLLFERFLNPERISLPDFDIDFCQIRRDEVIKYVQEKYGEDRVAQIITFGKLQARAVLRDVGRVLQIPYGQVDKIAKLVPFNAVNPVTLGQAVEMEPLLKQASKEDPEIENLINTALKLEGLHRHASTHAAGIVIADRPLHEILPLYSDDKSNMLVVQYSMKYAELAGLVKFDFLGLKTLTVISDAVKLIHKKNPDFNIDAIPLNDPKVFELMSKGLSTGVFQFESSGMKDALRKMRPDSFEDLVALGALYRPGPMDNIPTYIACKHGIQTPDYLHPSLESMLKETFGVIIYQEQVMQIAQILAGYSLGAADLLRKAMGKKIKAEMDAQREIFVAGAIKNNISESQASYIFDLVAKFAGYGFNKAHATAYAWISYQTAYLKANYLTEFLTASLNLEIDDTDKINLFQQEAKYLCIEILPPDINLSQSLFTIEKGAIRYGLGGLKSIGVQAMEQLCQERESKFADIFDFTGKVSSKILNKRSLESLIKAGAFDKIHPNRQQLFLSVDLLINYNNIINKAAQSNQLTLFGSKTCESYKPSLPKITDWPDKEKIIYEYEAIGFYLSSHPLDQYKELLEQTKIITSDYLKNEQIMGYSTVEIAGMVISSKARVSPRGRYMTAVFSDNLGSIEISFFDDATLKKAAQVFEKNIPLVIKAEVRKDEGGIRVTGQNIISLDEYLSDRIKYIELTIKDKSVIQPLKLILKDKSEGKASIILKVITESNE